MAAGVQNLAQDIFNELLETGGLEFGSHPRRVLAERMASMMLMVEMTMMMTTTILLLLVFFSGFQNSFLEMI